MIEVHNNPDEALSDGPQSLTLSQFENLVDDLEILSSVTGKRFEKQKTEMVDV